LSIELTGASPLGNNTSNTYARTRARADGPARRARRRRRRRRAAAAAAAAAARAPPRQAPADARGRSGFCAHFCCGTHLTIVSVSLLSPAEQMRGGPPPAAAVSSDESVHAVRDDEDDQLPRWWLCFLPLYWQPQRLTCGMIQTYLLPFQVTAIVGKAHEHVAYGVMVTSVHIGSASGPIWGAWTDSCISRDGRYRRRLFVVAGQLIFCFALLVMEQASSFLVLLLSYMLFSLTANISGAPYVVINTAVPKGQRGSYQSYDRWQELFANLGTQGLGVLIGKRLLSKPMAYLLSAVIAVFPTIPLGLIGLGERPGCWSKEPVRTASIALPTTKLCTLQRAGATCREFFSAFKHPPFRWLFVATVCANIYSTFSSLFFIYWFRDIVGGPSSSYTFMGRTICHDPRIALAISASISKGCEFVLTLPGGWVADRYADRRTMLMMVGCIAGVLSPVLNAFYPSFTVICALSLYGGIVGGVTGSCSRALQADCVPIDPNTGKPFAAARDYQLISYASFFPSLILPPALGILFSVFESQELAYKTFFLVSATIHFFAAFLYLKVGHELRRCMRLRASGLLLREPLIIGSAAKLSTKYPLGARLCDWILFGQCDGDAGSTSTAAATTRSKPRRRGSLRGSLQ
jgi:Na+/melibiose symporter-like transporter